MAKSSQEYWDDRAIKRLTDAEKQSEEYINRIQKIYSRANKNVQREIDNVYRNYAKNTGLDVQKLKEILSKTETQKLWDELKAQGLDQYVRKNYKARISRLEKIQAQIYAKAKEIYPQEQLEQTMCYTGVINDTFYKTIYDTQMGTGFDFAFSKIDDNMVSKLLNEKWSGANYSQRIWGNTDILAESLSEIIGGGMISGQSISKTARQVRERFDVGKYYSQRLVRTEVNHFNNEADAMAYEEMDVDEYVFLATLDTRTSDICQRLDNKRFKLKERKVGENYPPCHPNCRSKTRAYMGEEIEATLKRRARNPITNKTEIVDNISYKEWANKHGLNRNLTNNGKNSIINEKSQANIVNITDKAISKVPNVKINGYTTDQSVFIQEQHKELLRYARDNNNNNEVAFVFRKDLVDRTIIEGTDKKIDITEALFGKGSGLFVMHNHPRNTSISYDDIFEFIDCDEISTISIVKNNGTVEVVNKLANFNKNNAAVVLERAKRKYVKIGSDEEYQKVVKNTLIKLQKEEAFLQWIT
jgi:SPP1 gp7 family putative phage head morphogenesis protein